MCIIPPHPHTFRGRPTHSQVYRVCTRPSSTTFINYSKREVARGTHSGIWKVVKGPTGTKEPKGPKGPRGPKGHGPRDQQRDHRFEGGMFANFFP